VLWRFFTDFFLLVCSFARLLVCSAIFVLFSLYDSAKKVYRTKAKGPKAPTVSGQLIKAKKNATATWFHFTKSLAPRPPPRPPPPPAQPSVPPPFPPPPPPPPTSSSGGGGSGSSSSSRSVPAKELPPLNQFLTQSLQTAEYIDVFKNLARLLDIGKIMSFVWFVWVLS
jgi:hypothetical protein